MHPVERAKLLAREEKEAAAVLHDYEEENRHILRQQATLKNIRQKAYTKKINFRKKLIWYICDCGKTAPAIGKTLLSPEELKEIDNLLGIDSERSTVGVRSNCHCSVCQERQGKVDKLISDIRKGDIPLPDLGDISGYEFSEIRLVPTNSPITITFGDKTIRVYNVSKPMVGIAQRGTGVVEDE